MQNTFINIKPNCKKLAIALIPAIAFLAAGPCGAIGRVAGETWTLASFTYAKGRLYMRTLKEAICIGAN
ncbi:MAG: hypothetical protein CBD18_07710 [Opitutales bacterium TMED158]|nr:MAG: hypothetical protein CBD18_07710 [Opitutales bacterium TMED158]